MRVAKLTLRTLLRAPAGRMRSLSVASFAVLAVTFAAACDLPAVQWRAADTAVGQVLRYAIGDGRVTYLDTNSQIHVNVTDAETQIVVNRGAALISGKGDRPLEVLAGGVTLRSEQGEFSVRARGAVVDLLVDQGSVHLSRTGNRFAQWVRGFRPVLFAGESASVGAAGVSETKALTAEVIAHKQAWKDGWLWFSDETLAQAVERFNEYNTDRKLILTDSRLDGITVGGRFRPTDPDSFAATLKVIFGVKTAIRRTGRTPAGDIYLSADCSRMRLRCDTPLGQ